MSIHIGIFHADNDERYLNKNFSFTVFYYLRKDHILALVLEKIHLTVTHD